MRDIELYMEGGGGSGGSKQLLRVGMHQFLGKLRSAAREKGLELRVVCCGGRREAHSKSAAARKRAVCHVLLLVDSETIVKGDPREHLVAEDDWRDLASVPVEDIHLMVQVMETWLVADEDALQRYYGQDLRREELPGEENLECVAKADIIAAFDRATRHTQRGKYQKVGHATKLLAMINAERVRARCWHCDRLFDVLTSAIGAT